MFKPGVANSNAYRGQAGNISGRGELGQDDRNSGRGGQEGRVMANLRARCAFSEVSSSYPDPVIGTWWEYRSRVAEFSDSSGESVELDFL